MKRKYSVTIAGQDFILTSDEDVQYIKKLADYVTIKIDEIQRATNAVASHSVAILAALNIADELLRERRTGENLRRQVTRKTEGLARHIEEALKAQAGMPSDDDR